MARFMGPGPRMVTLLEMTSWPVVSVIVAGVVRAKLIVSPLAALANAVRSVPGPLLAVLVTVIVVASVGRVSPVTIRHAPTKSFRRFGRMFMVMVSFFGLYGTSRTR